MSTQAKGPASTMSSPNHLRSNANIGVQVVRTPGAHIPEGARVSGAVCTCKDCSKGRDRADNADPTGKYIGAYEKWLQASWLLKLALHFSEDASVARAKVLSTQQSMKINQGHRKFDKQRAQRECERIRKEHKEMFEQAEKNIL